MNKFPFPWGKVIKEFVYDFDGQVLKIIKYHPHKDYSGEIDTSKVEYYAPYFGQHSDEIFQLVLCWMMKEELGLYDGETVSRVYHTLKRAAEKEKLKKETTNG